MDKTFHAKGRIVKNPGAQKPFGWEWRKERHGNLVFSRNSLQFLEWNIPYSDIEEAVLYSPSESYLLSFISSVLRVKTVGEVYDFAVERLNVSGFNIPFRVEKQSEPILKRKHSILIFIAIVIAVILKVFL